MKDYSDSALNRRSQRPISALDCTVIEVIMKNIALGWPDETFPANAVVSERKSVEEATVFVGFDS
jgi:hypothetical protein